MVKGGTDAISAHALAPIAFCDVGSDAACDESDSKTIAFRAAGEQVLGEAKGMGTPQKAVI